MKRQRAMSTQSYHGSQSSSQTRRKRARKPTALKATQTGQQLSLLPNIYASNIPKWGFPNRLAIKHKYAEVTTLTSTSGGLVSYLYSCNGMYDPNITGTGTQPMYFDELGALYDHYTVIKSYAKFTFVTQSTLNNCAVVAVSIDDDATPPTSIAAGMQQGTATVKNYATSQTEPLVITKSWSSGLFGPDPLDNDKMSGTTAANPQEESLYCIQMQSIGAGNTTMFLTTEIWYYAIWDELKTNNGS